MSYQKNQISNATNLVVGLNRAALAEAHEKLLAEAVAAGDGELDNAAIIRRWKT
jgi:hypothetical protein